MKTEIKALVIQKPKAPAIQKELESEIVYQLRDPVSGGAD